MRSRKSPETPAACTSGEGAEGTKPELRRDFSYLSILVPYFSTENRMEKEMETGIILGILGVYISHVMNGHGFY